VVKRKVASWGNIQKPKRLTSLVMMLIIWAGVAGSLFAAITTDVSEKNYLKSRATTIAATQSFSQINKFKGDEEDLRTDGYRDVKAQLQRVRSENPDLSFVRIAQLHHGEVTFAVDSEIPYTRDYTSPGHPYPQASDVFHSTFNSTDSVTEGPFRDQWGLWMAAYAPITNPATNEVVGIVAIYTPAVNYYFKLGLYTLIPLLLAAIPFAGLLRDRKLESKEWEITGLKNQFVSIASHELRSPINGMLWAIQSLLKSDTNLTKQQRSLLNDMYHSTEASLATVNEILDLSVFERGENDHLRQETVDMVSVLREVAKTLKLGANEKNIRIVFEGDWPEYAYVLGDVAALKRSFMNLISNAIKYSPMHARVELGYRHHSATHAFFIRDHGIGIPKDEQDKVLDGYYRASNAVRIQANGTGLGLWITRLVIEQHGGTISLHSKLDSGTTIHVQLPSQRHATGVLKQATNAQPSALTT
jgi:signal transduction histidine kinase